MANTKRFGFGAIIGLAGLAVLFQAETLMAAPSKANPFATPTRCNQPGCAVRKIAAAPFEWWPLARPQKRRVDQVILILGVGF
ncbi:MAG: hypothetical protein ACXWKC_03230 [Xanthobacteraceae bacterium]